MLLLVVVLMPARSANSATPRADSHYTPTTEDIRLAYCDYSATGDLPAGEVEGDHIAEFDRWLAEHDRELSERVWDEGFAERGKYNALAGPVPILNPHKEAQA